MVLPLPLDDPDQPARRVGHFAGFDPAAGPGLVAIVDAIGGDLEFIPQKQAGHRVIIPARELDLQLVDGQARVGRQVGRGGQAHHRLKRGVGGDIKLEQLGRGIRLQPLETDQLDPGGPAIR